MEGANQALHNNMDTDPILGRGGRGGVFQPEKCFAPQFQSLASEFVLGKHAVVWTRAVLGIVVWMGVPQLSVKDSEERHGHSLPRWRDLERSLMHCTYPDLVGQWTHRIPKSALTVLLKPQRSVSLD